MNFCYHLETSKATKRQIVAMGQNSAFSCALFNNAELNRYRVTNIIDPLASVLLYSKV